jgi:hypothetical protein
MAELSFEPQYALPWMRNPDLEELRRIVLNPKGPGWDFGDARIRYEARGEQFTLIVLSHLELGYYLKYIDPRDEEWLSLGDASRLTEVVVPDDWEASIGLFIPPDRAWLAIEEFCQSGTRSNRIAWIRPEAVPDEGNW